MKIQALAYVLAETTDIGKWRHYAEQVLGMSTAEAAGGALYLKMDERAFRIAAIPGGADCYLASGWELAPGVDCDGTVAALKAAGVEVGDSSEAERKDASVSETLTDLRDIIANAHGNGIRLDEVLANAFWMMVIIIRPGTRNCGYGTPGYTSRRPDSACEKMNRYSSALTTGAAMVCMKTTVKRRTSLVNSVHKPSQFTTVPPRPCGGPRSVRGIRAPGSAPGY